MADSRVTYHGTMQDTTIINLPKEWVDKVDMDTISITLTPIGMYQELYVETIKWGKQVIVKSQSGGRISCYYTVNATLLES